MIEIVKELRDEAQSGREVIERWQMDPYLYDKAADEIERLRAALQKHGHHTSGCSHNYGHDCNCGWQVLKQGA